MIHRFFVPTVNALGPGSLNQVGKHAKRLHAKRALVVTDAMLNKIGIVAKMTRYLDESGIDYVVFDNVKANPTTQTVDEGLEVYKSHQCNIIIAIGGGSPIDCGKAIAILATNGGSITDYNGVNLIHTALPPVIAITTTAGTASEITRFTVITDMERHKKMTLVDWHITPKVSINDPELMLDLPPSITAATGMDALTHAIEAYVSRRAYPLTDSAAIEAIRLIGENLPKVVKNGHDLTARENMCYGQFLAGVAFNNAGLGAVHAISHQVGAFYNLPHGVCNAILLPHVCKFNAQSRMERFIDIGKALGENMEGLPKRQAAQKTYAALSKLLSQLNLPTTLSALHVNRADIPHLATETMTEFCLETNPREASRDDIISLLHETM